MQPTAEAYPLILRYCLEHGSCNCAWPEAIYGIADLSFVLVCLPYAMFDGSCLCL